MAEKIDDRAKKFLSRKVKTIEVRAPKTVSQLLSAKP